MTWDALIAVVEVAESSELSSRGLAAPAVEPRQSVLPAQQEYMTPRAYSRSESVSSSVHGRHDDIPSIMMRGATDLRNAKFEIEELVISPCGSRAYMHCQPHS